MLAIATLAAVAALAFGVIAGRAPSGQAQYSAATTADRGAVKGAVSYRATAVTAPRGHWRALQMTFVRAHAGSELSPPVPLRVLEATRKRVLWAMATFALGDGTIVTERFSWRRGVGWRDLGPTRALCPAVPSEVRAAWRLVTCP